MFSLDAKTHVIKGGLDTDVNQNVPVKTMQLVTLQVVSVTALVDGG